MGRTSPEATRTDSGFLSLCRGHLRSFVSENEITLPPAPESMRAVHACPRTSIGIVSNGDTRSMSTDKLNTRLDKLIEQTSQRTLQIIQQDKQASHQNAELLQKIKYLSQSIHTTQTRTLPLNVDPNFLIFDYRSQTIKEWIQEIHERSQVLNLPETSNVLYAKLQCPNK